MTSDDARDSRGEAEAYLIVELGDDQEALDAALQWQQLMLEGEHLGAALGAVQNYLTHGYILPPQSDGSHDFFPAVDEDDGMAIDDVQGRGQNWGKADDAPSGKPSPEGAPQDPPLHWPAPAARFSPINLEDGAPDVTSMAPDGEPDQEPPEASGSGAALQNPPPGGRDNDREGPTDNGQETLHDHRRNTATSGQAARNQSPIPPDAQEELAHLFKQQQQQKRLQQKDIATKANERGSDGWKILERFHVEHIKISVDTIRNLVKNIGKTKKQSPRLSDRIWTQLEPFLDRYADDSAADAAAAFNVDPDVRETLREYGHKNRKFSAKTISYRRDVLRESRQDDDMDVGPDGDPGQEPPQASGSGATLQNPPLTLGDRQWLTDDHIYAGFQALQEHLSSTNPALAAITRFIRPSIAYLLAADSTQADAQLNDIYVDRQGQDTARYIFAPVTNQGHQPGAQRVDGFEGSHWSLLMIDRREGQAYHYDSVQGVGQQHAGSLAGAIAHASPVHDSSMAQQINGYDCGVAALSAAWALINTLPTVGALPEETLDLSSVSIDRAPVQALLGGQPARADEDLDEDESDHRDEERGDDPDPDPAATAEGEPNAAGPSAGKRRVRIPSAVWKLLGPYIDELGPSKPAAVAKALNTDPKVVQLFKDNKLKGRTLTTSDIDNYRQRNPAAPRPATGRQSPIPPDASEELIPLFQKQLQQNWARTRILEEANRDGSEARKILRRHNADHIVINRNHVSHFIAHAGEISTRASKLTNRVWKQLDPFLVRLVRSDAADAADAAAEFNGDPEVQDVLAANGHTGRIFTIEDIRLRRAVLKKPAPAQ